MRLVVLLALLAAAVFGARYPMVRHLEEGMLKIHGKGSRTPQARGLPYDPIPIASGDHKLESFYVPADGPDLLDSLENVARVQGPLLVEHGSEDELFPTAWAQRLAAARPGAQLEIVRGMHHADPVAHPSDASWGPVIRFVKR